VEDSCVDFFISLMKKAIIIWSIGTMLIGCCGNS
jgi:hypothetical protein